MMNQFPASFLWGASSSAFQIEGGWDEGGKGMTVADFNSFKLSDKQADTKVASDFYHHWKEDIDLMKELGLKAYRFSLSWARIIPDGDGEVNPEGIAFYNKVIDYLIEQGIRPLVTLYHFDLPYALVEKYNGWECRDCAYAFERYARVCFRAFGDRVKYWQVINDTQVSAADMLRHRSRMYHTYKEMCIQLGVYDKFRLRLHGIYLSLFESPLPNGPVQKLSDAFARTHSRI